MKWSVGLRRSGTGSAPVDPDEETIVLEDLARADFTRRRRQERWHRARLWLISMLVLVILGGVVWLVFFSRFLIVKTVVVSGEGTISTKRVIRTAAVPMGQPLARVDLDEIQSRVESLPPVKSAEVTRDWPDSISIALTPRTPVAVIDLGSGLEAFDLQGALFGHYESRPQGLPLVQAAADTKKIALSEAAKVIKELPEDLLAKVDFIKVASVDQITMVLHTGRTIMWGSSAQSDQKAEVLAVLLQQPGNHFDISVPSQPTIK